MSSLVFDYLEGFGENRPDGETPTWLVRPDLYNPPSFFVRVIVSPVLRFNSIYIKSRESRTGNVSVVFSPLLDEHPDPRKSVI